MKEHIFSVEIEKIARSKERVNASAVAKGILAQGLGFAGGYGTAKYVYPKILQTLGKTPKPISGRAATLLGFATGLGMLGAHLSRRRYVNDSKIRLNRGKNRKNKAVLSDNKQLAKRLQGHSPKVPKDILRSDAGRSVQVQSGKLPVRRGDSRGRDGANNNGRGDDRYKFRGKKTRHYRFKDPFSV